MNKNKSIILILFLFFAVRFNLFAQELNCDNAIDEATEIYNAGKYEGCATYLNQVIESCRLSKKKKEKAYELIINSNIELDNLAAIDSSFKNMLKFEPNYDIKDYQGIDEYIKFYKDYYVYPKFCIGISTAFAKPFIISSAVYKVIPTANYNSKFVSATFLNAALFYEYRIKEKWSIYGEINQNKINYKREITNDFWKLNYSEDIKMLELNFAIKRYFSTSKKLNYYFYAGLTNEVIVSDKLNLSQEIKVVDPFNESVTQSKKSLTAFDPSLLRNKYLYGFLTGGGLTYRIGHIGLGLDLRFNYLINHLNVRKNRYYEPILIRDFSYLENDMRLMRMQASITACYYFKFNVRNKKQND